MDGKLTYELFFLFAPAMAAVAVSAPLVFAPRRRPSSNDTLVGLLIVVGGWFIFSAMELTATTPAASLFWSKVTYPFVAATPLFWLLFCLFYLQYDRWLTAGWIRLFALIPGITLLLVVTSGAHSLLWQESLLLQKGGELALQFQSGAWFWVQQTYTDLIVLLCGILVARRTLASAPIQGRRTPWYLAGAVAPLAASLIELPASLPMIDHFFTPFSFILGAGFFTIGMLRTRRFDLKPFAWATLFERMNDPMLIVDEVDRIVDLNPAAVNTFGQPASRLLYRNIQSLLQHEVGLPVAHACHEVEIVREGESRYFDLQISPLGRELSRPEGALILMRDMSERERARQALAKRTQELEGKNQQLDAFAHTVAHDLKTPIAAILGFSELLAAELNDRPELLDMASFIATSSRKMNMIIEGLLLLATVNNDEVERTPIAMQSLVDETLIRFRQTINRKGAEITMPDEWPVVLGFAPWIEEIWANYLSNAIKYGGDSPQIEIGSTRIHSADGELLRIRYWVQDNGPGIADDKQEVLFELFSRVGTNDIEGHGLGLSIVKRIADRLGGSVGVESQTGQGSRFWFELPPASRQMLASSQSKAEQVDESVQDAPSNPEGDEPADSEQSSPESSLSTNQWRRSGLKR